MGFLTAAKLEPGKLILKGEENPGTADPNSSLRTRQATILKFKGRRRRKVEVQVEGNLSLLFVLS